MAKKQIFKSFAELAEASLAQAAKHADVVAKTKRPRTLVIKKPLMEVEKVMYTPTHKFTAEEKQIYNAGNKYKSAEPYVSMPEDEAYKLFIEDGNFRHDPSRIAVRDLGQTINQMDRTSGTTTPSGMRHAMSKVISQNPEALMSFPPPAPKFGSKQRIIVPEISDIPDYFAPQQYRGIDNIDSTFEQAKLMSKIGADDTANQFLSAGLGDVAAIARGTKPTSFKYKPVTGNISKQILEEMVARRNSPIGTLEGLQKINSKNPELGISYLDMFAQKPNHFRQMFNPDGSMIK